MNWGLAIVGAVVYLVLAGVTGSMLGRLLQRASDRAIPAAWLARNHPLPCLYCNGEVTPYLLDGQWVMGCADCGRMMPADEYRETLRESRKQADVPDHEREREKRCAD